jgi:hypothetical protein
MFMKRRMKTMIFCAGPLAMILGLTSCGGRLTVNGPATPGPAQAVRHINTPAVAPEDREVRITKYQNGGVDGEVENVVAVSWLDRDGMPVVKDDMPDSIHKAHMSADGKYVVLQRPGTHDDHYPFTSHDGRIQWFADPQTNTLFAIYLRNGAELTTVNGHWNETRTAYSAFNMAEKFPSQDEKDPTAPNQYHTTYANLRLRSLD